MHLIININMTLNIYMYVYIVIAYLWNNISLKTFEWLPCDKVIFYSDYNERLKWFIK